MKIITYAIFYHKVLLAALNLVALYQIQTFWGICLNELITALDDQSMIRFKIICFSNTGWKAEVFNELNSI